MSNVNASLLSAASRVFFSSGLVSAARFLSDYLVAYYFGVGDAVDSLVIALLIPMFTASTLGGSLVTAFLPVFVDSKENQGLDAARGLLTQVLFLLSIALVLLMLCMGAFSELIASRIAPAFSAEKIHETSCLLFILAPRALLDSLESLFSAILNAIGSFSLPAAIPAIRPLVASTFLYFSGGESISALAYGLTIGSAASVGCLMIMMWKRATFPCSKWPSNSAPLAKVRNQFVGTFFAVLLWAGLPVTDRLMAARLPSGNVAALSYGTKFVTVFIGLASAALGTAVLPAYSRLFANKRTIEIRTSLRALLSWIFLVSMPIVLLVCLNSRTLVSLAFGFGAFDDCAMDATARLQAIEVFKLPFFAAGIVLGRTVNAMQRNSAIAIGTGSCLLINAGLNLAFMKSHGVEGIAFSTVAVSALQFLFLLAMTYILLNQLDEKLADV